jgi:type IV secretory pathway VirB2 component (pilin)
MQAIESYLLQIVSFFTGNWIAALILAAVIVLLYLKKPKLLFQLVGLIVLAVALLYIMIFLEKSLFSGVTSKERSYDVERQLK